MLVGLHRPVCGRGRASSAIPSPAGTLSALTGDPAIGLVAALKDYAVDQAVRRELDGYVTSSSSRDDIERLGAHHGATGTPSWTQEKQLTKGTAGGPGYGRAFRAECKKALRRWYG